MNARKIGVLCSLALATACQDLDTTNLTNPDQDRALSQPGDVESLIGSQFKVWHDNSGGAYPSWGLSVAGDEGTSSWGNQAMQQMGSEPRAAFPNNTAFSYRGLLETPWFGMYRVLSSVNDGLRAIDGGMKFGANGADTKRAETFAKLVQGLAHAWLALQFDQAFVFTEDDNLETVEFTLVDYKQIMTKAIAMLDEAASLAGGNSFTLPGNWINGQTINNVELARIAKSYSARFLAAVARTPADRTAVNWQEVLTRVNAGITRDFGFTLDATNWTESYKERLQRFDWMRADYRTVGPADASGNYQKWLATAVAERLTFDITTTDRRIQGTTPKSDGTDFYYRSTQNFPQDRGTYHWSNYGHKRYLSIRQTQIGFNPILTLVEMDLLKAEAYIRTNQAPLAPALINKTRVARGQLPAVTVDGPPADPTCVPRTTTGACGNLMDALIYEKRIEMFGVASGLAFFDARGWGYLVPGTPIHLPIPARELETLGMPSYTFGGVGSPGAAR